MKNPQPEPGVVFWLVRPYRILSKRRLIMAWVVPVVKPAPTQGLPMSKGHVYALINDAMPGIVKIGRTENSVKSRATALFQTGVPQPFKVLHSAYCPDCKEAEREIHDLLNEFRVSSGREFFSVSKEDAVSIINDIVHCQIFYFVSEFMPGKVVTDEFLALDSPSVEIISQRLNEDFMTVAAAYGEITEDELAPAISRVREKMKKRGVKA